MFRIRVMNEAVLILPNHLFKSHPAVNKGRVHVLFEHHRYFKDFKYHKKKLIFHRASMKAYRDYLESLKLRTAYFTAAVNIKDLFNNLRKNRIALIHLIDPEDKIINDEINKLSAENEIKPIIYQSPSFLFDRESVAEKIGKRRRYSMHNYYIEQRKESGILTEDGDPAGGKWSFDTENRKKISKDIRLPPEPKENINEYINEAREYVSLNFGSNPGTEENFFYPVNFKEAERWLDDFIENRLYDFGAYQDAVLKDRFLIFHSLLSPLLNSGLLLPQNIAGSALAAEDRKKIPLSSLEGFIRQIMGWREFVRAVNIIEGENQKRLNFWNHTRKMPEAFYTASTGIEPVDDSIRKARNYAYAHHIERLMILGNFMLLCEIDPKEVYRWFMEMFIDAYDWVMTPNVFGMSQFSDGGLMSTKPYISSSNYILKMSDYKKGEWSEIWDGLFWRFVIKNMEVFKKNPRTAALPAYVKKIDKDKLERLTAKAEKFLESFKVKEEAVF